MSIPTDFNGRYTPVLSADGRWVLFGDNDAYARAQIESVCVRDWKQSGHVWWHVCIKMISGERVYGRATNRHEATRQLWMIMGTTPVAPASTTIPTTAARAASAAAP